MTGNAELERLLDMSKPIPPEKELKLLFTIGGFALTGLLVAEVVRRKQPGIGHKIAAGSGRLLDFAVRETERHIDAWKKARAAR